MKISLKNRGLAAGLWLTFCTAHLLYLKKNRTKFLEFNYNNVLNK